MKIEKSVKIQGIIKFQIVEIETRKNSRSGNFKVFLGICNLTVKSEIYYTSKKIHSLAELAR